GYQEEGSWVIPMRAWVHEHRGLPEIVKAKVAASLGNLAPREIGNFDSRIQDFVGDSESDEAVTFAFDHDPEKQEYRIRDSPGNFPESNEDGLVEGVIRISLTKAAELLSRQGSDHGWLTYRATSSEHS